MTNVVGQAFDEFQSAAKQLTSGTSSTMGGSNSTPSTNSSKNLSGKAFKSQSSESVLDILQRAQALPKKQKFEPRGLPVIGNQIKPAKLNGSGLFHNNTNFEESKY